METNTQSRRLTIHPAMIFDIIQRQSGTLGKAILEGVMNSVDAGATRCDIKLTEGAYQISDDGKGFRDQDEIVSFFETFGTPHEEGDATFGRYRMGRGQGFSFGINQWQTGAFDMRVDIKGRGLDYDLNVNTGNPVPGCKIDVTLYQPMAPGELLSAIREVKGLCEWMPIPVYLNDTLISKSISDENWDVETDDYVIKRKSNGGIKLYNIGAFVKNCSPYDFGGFNGIVISKRQLQVNFARNDVLVNQCPIYKEIRETLRKLGGVTRKSNRLTNDDRAAMLRAAYETGEATKEFIKQKVIPAYPSRYVSISNIFDNVVVVSEHDDQRLAERAKNQSRDSTIFLKAEVMSWIGIDPDDYAGLAEALEIIRDNASVASWGYARSRKINVKPLSSVTKGMSASYTAIPYSDQTRVERLALRALKRAVGDVALVMRSMGTEHRLRDCLLGESTSALAWTDGVTRITFDRKHLGQCIKSVSGFQSLVGIIVHEMLHTESDEQSHIHDEDFYREFHDLMLDPRLMSGALGAAVLFARSVMSLSDLGAREVSAQLSKELDSLFGIRVSGDCELESEAA